MSASFTWSDVWNILGNADATCRDDIYQEVMKVLKSLPVSEQIKALADCPTELRDKVAQELAPEVRRKYNISTVNVDWSKLTTQRR